MKYWPPLNRYWKTISVITNQSEMGWRIISKAMDWVQKLCLNSALPSRQAHAHMCPEEIQAIWFLWRERVVCYCSLPESHGLILSFEPLWVNMELLLKFKWHLPHWCFHTPYWDVKTPKDATKDCPAIRQSFNCWDLVSREECRPEYRGTYEWKCSWTPAP